MIEYTGVILLLAWAVNVWVFLTIFAARPGLIRMCLWAAVLLVPVLGFLIWFVFGRSHSHGRN